VIITKEEFEQLMSGKDFTTKEVQLTSPKSINIIQYFINGEKVANVATPAGEPTVYQIT
jgi:hypothetical protein